MNCMLCQKNTATENCEKCGAPICEDCLEIDLVSMETSMATAFDSFLTMKVCKTCYDKNLRKG